MTTLAGAALLLLSIVAWQRHLDGTLGPWLRSKFFNAGDPSGRPAVEGVAFDGPSGFGSPSGWLPPLGGFRARLSSLFGDPRDGGRRSHDGIDFAAPIGTPVYASRAGRVTDARTAGGYGLLVTIDHGDGWETRYAHLDDFNVRHGQVVPAGAMIGRVGNTGTSTGPHLHWEIRRHGSALDPLAHLPWLRDAA